MGHPQPRAMTPEEVLDWEGSQPERYEYVGGILRMMVGGSSTHNSIVFSLRTSLYRRLRERGCRVFSETMRLVVPTGEFTYPDVFVNCSARHQVTDRFDDAMLVAEVLSPSTADYDQGAKWSLYREVPSLQTFMLIDQKRRHLEIYRREGASWRFHVVESGTVEVMDGIEIPLDEIYEDVDVA